MYRKRRGGFDLVTAPVGRKNELRKKKKNKRKMGALIFLATLHFSFLAVAPLIMAS